ncbi:MAG: SDR family oxidoreductase [candidate division KSB1 bacterium]|nr:SDR family oxidoreductase [candidate division KSB1 bacterium]
MGAGAALITGAAKRIGRAIALELARAGFDIGIHYRGGAEAAKEAKAEIEQLGVRCELFEADFGPGFQAEELVRRAAELLPGLSVLVNNVSVFEAGDLLDVDEKQFERVLAVNLRAPFFLTQAFARHCRKGVVVNILDTRVAQNPTQHFVYTLSKKALREFTKMAALALAPDIRVSAVCPGAILPPPGQDASYLAEKARRIPARRSGSPEDVARAVLYLVQNPFVTGEEIFVDGGEHLL